MRRTICLCVILLALQVPCLHAKKAINKYLIVQRDSSSFFFSLINSHTIALIRSNSYTHVILDSVIAGQALGTFGFKFRGISIGYYKEGVVKNVAANFNYAYQGNHYSFFINGQLHEITPYKDGVVNGTYLRYNEKGLLIVKSENADGLKNGKETVYDFKGRPFFETTYIADIRNGE